MNKKLDIKDLNVLERKKMRNHVTINHAQLIASGQAGLVGQIVPKNVAVE